MKKRTAIICLTAACLLSGCANYVKDGTELLEQGEYAEAVTAFENVVSDESAKQEQLAEAYRGLGIAYYEQQDYANALENLQSALDAGGDETAEIYNLIGICNMNTGDYAAALEAFSTGIALYSYEESSEDSTESSSAELLQEMLYNQVICYEETQDWASAKTAAAEYLSSYPDDEAMQKEAEFLETQGE